MAQWLEAALRESTARWKIVIGHHPIWSSAGSKFQQARMLRRLILPALCRYADHVPRRPRAHARGPHGSCQGRARGARPPSAAADRVRGSRQATPAQYGVCAPPARRQPGAQEPVGRGPNLGLCACDTGAGSGHNPERRRGLLSALSRPTCARDSGQPLYSLHVPRALHPYLRGVRSAEEDDRTRVPIAYPASSSA